MSTRKDEDIGWLDPDEKLLPDGGDIVVTELTGGKHDLLVVDEDLELCLVAEIGPAPDLRGEEIGAPRGISRCYETDALRPSIRTPSVFSNARF